MVVRLRQIFAPFVKRIAKFCVRLHITPNQATGLMLVCAFIASLGLIVNLDLLWFGIWIFITGLMDGVDGAIARLTNHSTKFGGVLDSVMDRVSEIVIFSSVILVQNGLFSFNSFWNSIIIAIGYVFSALITYVRSRIDLECINFESPKDGSNVGLMGRSERLFYLFLLSVLCWILQTFISVDPKIVFSWGFIGFDVIVLFTFYYRFINYARFLKKH